MRTSKIIWIVFLLTAFCFTTNKGYAQILASPELQSPSNGASEQPIALTLDWNSVVGALSYQVQVSTSQNFNNLVVDQNGITGTSLDISGLDYETTYYWRVRATNEVTTSDWSNIWNFTTQEAPSNPPDAPSLSSPSDGASGVSTSPTLNWNSSQGADTYHLQVATDASFSSPVINESGLSSTSYQASGLDHSTTYYWRVRASNEDGNSPWSAEWSFTTEESTPQPPPAPTLESPSNGSDGTSTSPTLQWNSADRADTYQLQVATDNGFSNLLVNESGLSGTSHQVSNLDNSTTYYWRVRASNEGGTGDWSDVWNFTTQEAPSNPPDAPSLSSPSDGASGVTTSPTLDWNNSQGADTYHLQVATDASFSSPVINESGLSSTSYQASGLDHSTTYYWRVRASNEDGNSPWSAEWSFTTEASTPQPPPAPTLESPSNGTDGTSTSPTLQWNSADRADTYQLQVATDNSFSNLITNESGLSGTSHQVSNLDHSTTYYWRVRASNEGGTGDWSDVWNFTTQEPASNPPDAPTLSAPSDGAEGVSTNPTLDWNSADRADSYELQVATDGNFNTVVIDRDGLTTTDYQTDSLDYSTTYYWRVRAQNSDGSSSWSPVWNFTTQNQPQSPPATPELSSPSDESTGVSTTPTLDWNPADRSEEYRIQVAEDSGFGSLITDSSGVTSTELQTQPLNQSTTYYWRVQASNSAGNSDWSSTWNFTTQSEGTGEAPPPPQLVSPENGATDIPTTPLLDWDLSEGADTYDFQIATDRSFESIVTSLQDVTSTHYEADLNGSTTYYWRVKARNNNGESQWTNPWSFSTQNEGNAITIIDPKTKALWKAPNTHTIRWNATNQISSVRLEYSADDGETWNLIAEQINANDNVYGWKVPSLSTVNTRIKITDEGDPDNFAISPPFMIYPNSLQLNHEFGFPSSPSQSDYKLMALPAEINIPLDNIITGSYGDDWKAFHDNGQTENYLEEYDQSEQFAFQPGRGFWVVSRGNVPVNENVSPVNLDADTSYTIPLHEGWNIISNPFHTSVSWASVQAANSHSDPIWEFDEGFTETSVFESYKGYYFFNRDNRSELTIPFKPESTSKAKTATPTAGDDKMISLSVYKGGEKKSSIRFGIDPAVTHDPSKRFQPAPPGDFQKYKVTLKPTSEDKLKYNLAEIRRATIDEISELMVQLKSEAGEPITLKADGLDKLLPHHVVLVHQKTGKTYHLNDKNAIHTSFDEIHTNFKIIVGTPGEIEDQKQSFQLNHPTLSQNYPNPFNGQTVIEYSVPERMGLTEVNLDVFNILGRKVYTLINTQRQPGIYQVRWNGENETGRALASGVYYYRLRIGQSVITKKLTLIK